MAHFIQNTSLEPLFRFAATLGVSPERICDAAGLDLVAATISGGLVPASAAIDAVECASIASGYPNFGLLMSERLQSRTIGLPALIAEQCRSIPDYYDLMQQYLGRHTTGYALLLDHDVSGGAGRLRILSRGEQEPRQFAEMALAIHARVLSRIGLSTCRARIAFSMLTFVISRSGGVSCMSHRDVSSPPSTDGNK